MPSRESEAMIGARTPAGLRFAALDDPVATVAPWLFVLLWSTGFIGAKYGLPYAEPFTYLTLRMAIAAVVMFAVTAARRAPMPRERAALWDVAVVGLLLHGGYLGGVFFAIDHDMPAGLSALIVGLQPVVTAVLAQSLLRERVSARQWVGLIAGFAGVGLVVEEQVTADLAHPIPGRAFVAIVIALAASTAGTIYQKRRATRVDLTLSAAVQYLAAGSVFALVAFGFESRRIEWTHQFLFALVWQVVVLSIGAVLLMLWLIREHSVSQISSLLFLVPPATAIQAYLLFGERLGLTALIGMAMVAGGVALVVGNLGRARSLARAAGG